MAALGSLASYGGAALGLLGASALLAPAMDWSASAQGLGLMAGAVGVAAAFAKVGAVLTAVNGAFMVFYNGSRAARGEAMDMERKPGNDAWRSGAMGLMAGAIPIALAAGGQFLQVAGNALPAAPWVASVASVAFPAMLFAGLLAGMVAMRQSLKDNLKVADSYLPGLAEKLVQRRDAGARARKGGGAGPRWRPPGAADSRLVK